MDRRDFISAAGLAAAGTLAARPARADVGKGSAEILIDYGKPGHKVPRTIYSHFIEELGKCIEGGIWRPVKGTDQFLGGVPWDLVAAVKKLRPAMIRYPGGCFADNYHWREGIGAMGSRKVTRNQFWGRFGKKVGPDVLNQFGTDEFILFCREVGAEPMLTANVGTGAPAEAAAWVEYCNGPVTSEWGAARAKNGHAEPFNVKYWFVGNEMWNPADGGFTAEKYARRYLEFSQAMRAKDPELKLILSGFTDPKNSWNKKVMAVAGQDTDYLSIHAYYPINLIVVDGQMKKMFFYDRIFKGLDKFESSLNLGINAIKEWGQDREVKVTFDEWNLWYHPYEVVQTNFNLRDGLFVAAMLNRLQRLADKVPIANIAQMVNCIGIIVSDERGTFLTPGAWAFNLYTEKTLDRYLPPAINPPVPGLEVSATRDDAGQKLSLFLVNCERDQNLDAKISLAGFAPQAEAELAVIWHADPMKYNTFAEPNAIVPRVSKTTLNLADQAGRAAFNLQLPAHSISVISLTKK